MDEKWGWAQEMLEVGTVTDEEAEDLLDYVCELKRKADALDGQIGKLASVLLHEFGGPTQPESACEMAIRLLREYKRKADALDKFERWMKAHDFSVEYRDEEFTLLKCFPVLDHSISFYKLLYTQECFLASYCCQLSKDQPVRPLNLPNSGEMANCIVGVGVHLIDAIAMLKEAE